MTFGARANWSVNTGAASVSLSGATYSLIGVSPASVEFNNINQCYATDTNATLNFQYNWLSGGSAANYDIRATILSGTFSSGSVGTWLNLSGTRSWTRGAAAGTFQSVTALFEIRNASTLVVLASANITLESDRT